ncbi:basic salivary proline-rich protein 2-like [Frankliniella occidentalis]|uniref:Basic salivary proline-rich protein 2-like n=1 Tax=Frankliniella occidentalis TaxID=133901 RepID=A0A6J1SNE9_FRAOC|nr:basic salivary proline-rich protein 2-like [Frankliniella occidentalis]
MEKETSRLTTASAAANGVVNAEGLPVGESPSAVSGRKNSARRPPSIVINPSVQVLSRQASGAPVSRSPSAQPPSQRRSRSVCHVHPSSCRCEKCPCPELTGAGGGAAAGLRRGPSGFSFGGGGQHWASAAMDRGQAGADCGYCGRLYLGRPPPFRRRQPPPLVMTRVPRSAGRYPTRGELLTGLTPTICWANCEKGLPLPPGCPRNMLHSLRAPPELFEELEPQPVGPYVRVLAPRWLDWVDDQTCAFPPPDGERGENLQCATCAQPKEEPAEAGKGKKKRRGEAEAEAEQGPPPELPAAPGAPDASPSKAVLVGSKATLGRASRGGLSARPSGAPVSVKLSGAPVSVSAKPSAAMSARGSAAGAPASARPSIRSASSRGQAPPPEPGLGDSSTAVRKPSGSLALRQDSAMPLPGVTSRSAVSVKPPLDGIRESATSTPVAELPPPPPPEEQEAVEEVPEDAVEEAPPEPVEEAAPEPVEEAAPPEPVEESVAGEEGAVPPEE